MYEISPRLAGAASTAWGGGGGGGVAEIWHMIHRSCQVVLQYRVSDMHE